MHSDADQICSFVNETMARSTAGSFFCEYRGQLITAAEARRREFAYNAVGVGSYMYFFEHNGARHWCVSICRIVSVLLNS